MKKILYVVNGLGFSRQMPIGGADKRVAQIGRRLARKGWAVSVLTTDEGQRVLKDDGLEADYLVTPPPFFWRASWYQSLGGRLISYFYLTLFSPRTVLTSSGRYDLIYSSSDFFFDLIPILMLRRRFRWLPLVAIVHHHLDVPWRRRGGWGKNVLLFLGQRFDFFLLKFFDAIFVPDNFEGENIRKTLGGYRIGSARLKPFKNGVDFTEISATPAVEKRFEACFLGGLRPSKGLEDLVPFWQAVGRKIPSARLLVIGGGTKEYEGWLRERIEKAGLAQKIILAGVLPRQTLFSFVKSARVFVSPSYEEGWGIAILEAMAAGLPAVGYDLPAYRPYGEALVKVPVGETAALARAVLELLRDEKRLSQKSQEGLVLASRFDWEKAFALERDVLENL